MNIVKYQTYLLQLENYELFRYWKLLLSSGYFGRKSSLRKKLIWTNKIKAILALAVILILLIDVYMYQVIGSVILAIILAEYLLFPFFLSIATLIIFPADLAIKMLIISKAKQKIKGKKVIGIAGSYGKTTMKNIVTKLLSGQYKVSSTPESVNTPIGIANWINNDVNNNDQILVIEMGEHYRDDIRGISKFVNPEIVIVTGINEAHLERLKNMDNTIAAIFEIVEEAKDNSIILLNGDDKNVADNYKKYLRSEQEAVLYSEKNHDAEFDERKMFWTADFEGTSKVNVRLLGKYVLGDIEAAIVIAKKLGVSDNKIRFSVNNLSQTKHRLEPILSDQNVLVIDDSYNGNPDGVDHAIRLLSQFKLRRKIYLTPGLVEMGDESEKVHIKIGERLSKVADKVILIKNSVTPFIAKGLSMSDYPPENIIWFATAKEAHANLNKIIKKDDVVLFQNDWGDQYI